MTIRWFSILLIFVSTIVITSGCNRQEPSVLHILGKVNTSTLDVAFSPDGHLLAVGSFKEGVHIWRIADKTLMYSLGDQSAGSVVFSPDSQLLVTAGGGKGGTVDVWRLSDGTLLRTLDSTLTTWVHSLALSPNGQALAVGTSENVHIFTVADGMLQQTLETSGANVAYSPGGQVLAVANNLPTVQLWDLSAKTLVRSFPGHGSSMAYAPNGQLLASPGWNNEGMVTFEGAEAFPTVAAGGDNIIQLWNTANGSPLRALIGHGGQIGSLAFSPNGQLIVSSANDQTVRLWRIADGMQIGMINLEGAGSVAFAPDSHTVAIGAFNTVYLWSVADIVQTMAPAE